MTTASSPAIIPEALVDAESSHYTPHFILPLTSNSVPDVEKTQIRSNQTKRKELDVNEAPETIDLGTQYSIEGRTVLHHSQTTIDGQIVPTYGDRWNVFGRRFYVSKSGRSLHTMDGEGYEELSASNFLRLANANPTGVRFEGRAAASLPHPVDREDTDYSYVAARALIEAIGVPLWHLADHSGHSETFFEEIMAGRLLPTHYELPSLIELILDHENCGEWKEPRGTVFPPNPFLDDDGTDIEGSATPPFRLVEDDASASPDGGVSPLNRAIASLVSRYVKDAGMSWSDLADADEGDQNDLFFMMTGQTEFTVGEVYRIAKAIGTTLPEIVRQAEILAGKEAN